MSPAGAGSDDRRRPQFDCFSSFLFSFSFFCQSPIFGYDGKPFVRLWIRIWKGEENCQSVLACTHVILRSVGGGRGEIEILKMDALVVLYAKSNLVLSLASAKSL